MREALTAYAFLLPSFLGLAVFTLYPLVYSGYLSLTRWDMLSLEKRFVWFRNYQRLIDDSDLWKIMSNTTVYTFSVVGITLVLALGRAILLNQKFRLRAVIRTILFLPVVTSLAALSALWLWIYDPEFGLANWLLTTSCLAAYAFARLNFPGKNLLFLLYLSIMMAPSQVTLIPNFVTLRQLNLLDTYGALILPFLASGFGAVLIRQQFLTMPADLGDAARIDGAGHLLTLWHVYIPLARPVIASFGLLSAMWHWNDFF